MVSQACDARSVGPLSIPIRNVSLSQQTVVRGVAISVGTPPQSLAFAVTGYANNSYVFDEADNECSNGTSVALCTEQTGGLFDESVSSSWSQKAPFYVATENHDPMPTTGDFFGTDTLQLGLSTYLPSFSFGILRNNVYNKNSLGLSSNSTLINSLLGANMISSRTWSIFWGLIGPESSSQADGTLTFGGYDTGRASGDNLTLSIQDPIGPPVAPFDGNCATGFQVEVAEITLDFPNGTSPSLFSTSQSPIPFCIDPADLLISLPPSFESTIDGILGSAITRTLGLERPGMLYSANQAFQGDLTITFTSGLDVKILNNQLIVPDIYIDQNGQPINYNTSQKILRLDPNVGVNVNNMPVLGQTFLTSAYLLVDYDKNQFTVWQADPTAPSQLVAISSETSCSNDTSSNPNSATSTTISTPHSSSQHSTNIGDIIGGVLGGLAVLTLVGSLFIWYRKRRRHLHLQEAPEQIPQVEKEKEPHPSTPMEMHGDASINEIGGNSRPQELPV